MLGTSARLLHLLALFQGRRYWSGNDLAARLEVTSRTLRRDVDKLRSLGYPIDSTTGVEGGYQLGAGSTMPPLLLNDDEAVAVALGLRSAAAGGLEGLGEIAVRALAKIEQILPSRLRRRVAALHAMVVSTEPSSPKVDARLLSIIAGACRDQERLRFRYCDRAGKATARDVEPHRLVHTGRRWYLVAWDAGRNDWRTFRVDRIEARVSTGSRFPPRDPPARDLAEYVMKGMWAAPPCRARIKLLAPAEVMAERLPPWAGVLEPIDERSCYLDSGASCYEELAMYVAFVGVDFECAEPPEFVEAVRLIGDRYRRAVSRQAL
jgi:predicted DNA-binding transcriptional regulator YafY